MLSGFSEESRKHSHCSAPLRNWAALPWQINRIIYASATTQVDHYQRSSKTGCHCKQLHPSAPETMLFFATADRWHSSFYTETGSRTGQRVLRRHMVNSNQVKSTTGQTGKGSHLVEVGRGVSSRRWQSGGISLPGKCAKTSAYILSWILQRDIEPKDSNYFLWQPKAQKHKHFSATGKYYLPKLIQWST